MSNLNRVIQFYSKGLFITPYFPAILTFSIVAQLYDILILNSVQQLVSALNLFLIPLFVLGVGFNIIRNKSTTIFEVSMVRSWKSIGQTRIIITILGNLPFLAIEGLMLYITGFTNLILPVIITTFLLSAYTLLASLISPNSSAIILAVILVYILPLANYLLLLNYAGNKYPPGVAISIFINSFLPLYSFQYSGILSFPNFYLQNIQDTILILLVLAVYYYSFMNQEIKI